MDWLKRIANLFTGGGDAGQEGQAGSSQSQAGGNPFPGGAGGNPAGAAEAMAHYADGSPVGAPPSPQMAQMYLRFRDSGMTPEQARQTVGQIQAIPETPNTPGPNAAGNVRAAPGYRPFGRR